jgi:NAD(P)-dependent dehydrogenase (short-subunit alcohol dehydrogenase family)
MKIEGARILVTGGARRVGRVIVESLARRHAHVIVHYHQSADDANSLATSLRAEGASVELVSANLEDQDAVSDLVNKLNDIDVLVNSAAIFPRTPLAQLNPEVWARTLSTNLTGPVFLAAQLGQKMRASGHGVIVNITDCGIRRPYKNYLPYLVSKAGLEMATQVLAIELAPEVRVVAVAPGTVLPPEDTSPRMRETLAKKSLLQKCGHPENVAQAVIFAIENDFLTATTITVDGGTVLNL